MKQTISVIIPVYNAASYVGEAVESALCQPETAEVILIEDGSSDSSLEVCRQLAGEDKRVNLYQHPGGVNRGAGASRNLGIQKARTEWIAFLDADDFYLDNRFAGACERLLHDSSVDGVYEAIGVTCENDAAHARWLKNSGRRLTTMTTGIDPDYLFEALIMGDKGWFLVDGLVVRRSAVQKAGGFPSHLRLCQDTAFTMKLAAVSRLVGGNLNEPVAMRRVHDNNRIGRDQKEFEYYRSLMWPYLLRWANQQKLSASRQNLLWIQVVNQCWKKRKKIENKYARSVMFRMWVLGWLCRHPQLLRIPVLRADLFGRFQAISMSDR